MKNLLILHGAIGSKEQFGLLKKQLENQYHIHTINFSGHGGEAFKTSFNIAQFADDVLVYLNQQHISSIDIFGYSMGGYVALYLAKNVPDRINKIITLGTKFSWTTEIAQQEVRMLDAEKIEEKIPAFAELLKLRHAPNNWKEVLAKTVEPDEDYVIPFGKARTVIEAEHDKIESGESIAIITYGRGVYWSLEAAKQFKGQIEIIDLRTLNPIDEEAMYTAAKKHNKVLLVTEESIENSFTLGLAARIQKNCFKHLDAPVEIVGSIDTPAIPLNSVLEATLLPNADKVAIAIQNLLSY